MAQQDKDHPHVRQALINDGWIILKEQFTLRYGGFTSSVDLVAQSALAATQGDNVIVVEVKSFRPTLRMQNLEQAIGQYLIYKSWLARKQPQWTLYLAITTQTARFFEEEPLRVICTDYGIRLLVVDSQHERIVAWKS